MQLLLVSPDLENSLAFDARSANTLEEALQALRDKMYRGLPYPLKHESPDHEFRQYLDWSVLVITRDQPELQTDCKGQLKNLDYGEPKLEVPTS